MGRIPNALFSAINADSICNSGQPSSYWEGVKPDYDSMSFVEAATCSFVNSWRKKFRPDDSSKQDTAAYIKWADCNSRSATWTDRSNTSVDEEFFGTMKMELDNFFYPNGYPLLHSLDSFFLAGRHGAGSSIGALSTDFYSKMFGSRLTSSNSVLIEHYQSNVRRFAE